MEQVVDHNEIALDARLPLSFADKLGFTLLMAFALLLTTPFWLLLLDAPYCGFMYDYPPGEGGGSLITDLLGSTEWAPGYDEAAFVQVRIGESADAVRAALGDPIMVLPRDSEHHFRDDWGFEDWWYAAPGGSWNYHSRILTITVGVVTEKSMAVYWD